MSKVTPDVPDSWNFFLADGTLIGAFPSGFLVTPLVFHLLMSAHSYAWQSPYVRN